MWKKIKVVHSLNEFVKIFLTLKIDLTDLAITWDTADKLTHFCLGTLIDKITDEEIDNTDKITIWQFQSKETTSNEKV